MLKLENLTRSLTYFLDFKNIFNPLINDLSADIFNSFLLCKCSSSKNIDWTLDSENHLKKKAFDEN